jgi:acyl carrier protein
MIGGYKSMTSEKYSAIANRICRVFVHSLALNIYPEDLPQVRDLGSVAGLDSLAMLNFVAELEEEFGFEIEADRLNIGFHGDLDALAEYFGERVSPLS